MVALGVTYNQALFEDDTLGSGSGISRMSTGTKARIDPQQVYTITKKRAKTAGKTRWAEYLA
jgi:hypothetical protein